MEMYNQGFGAPTQSAPQLNNQQSQQQSEQQKQSKTNFRIVIRVRPFLSEDSKVALAASEANKIQSFGLQNKALSNSNLNGKVNCLDIDQVTGQKISLVRQEYDQRDFFFDHVMGSEASQNKSYQLIAEPVVQDVLDGLNGVIMAYGQTGSGKTHTIFGSKPSTKNLYANQGLNEPVFQSGLVPRCVNHIFDYIKQNPIQGSFRVTISFLEIYMEQITDLLEIGQNVKKNRSTSRLGHSGSQSRAVNHQSSNSISPIRGSNNQIGGKIAPVSRIADSNQYGLSIREDPKTGIFVDGLTQLNVKSKEQLLQYVKQGMKNRQMNQTGMNKNSSRSHAILNIFLEQSWVEKQKVEGTNYNSLPQNDDIASPLPQQQSGVIKKRHYRKALLTIVDLAGSERLNKTGSESMRLQEAKNINKSIAALGNCISGLAQLSEKMAHSRSQIGIGTSHIPFRDSKLTRLLSESLSGNCKTTICACVSPSLVHYEETYSTLLFASRAMSVQSHAMINEKIELKFKQQQKVEQQLQQQIRMQVEAAQMKNSKSTQQQLFNDADQQGTNPRHAQSTVVFQKQFSQLEEEARDLRNEVQFLKDQLRGKNGAMSRQISHMSYASGQDDLVSQRSNENFEQRGGNGWPAGSPYQVSPYQQTQNVSGVSTTIGNNTTGISDSRLLEKDKLILKQQNQISEMASIIQNLQNQLILKDSE